MTILFFLSLMTLGNQGKTIDLPALEVELSKIKGIGGKRLEEIMTVIEKFLDV